MGLIKLGIMAAGAGYVVNKVTKSAEKTAEMKANSQQHPQNYYPEQRQYASRPPPQGPQYQSYDNRGPQYQYQGEGYSQQGQWERPAGELPPPQYRDAAAQGNNQQRAWERPAEGNMSGWSASNPDAKR